MHKAIPTISAHDTMQHHASMVQCGVVCVRDVCGRGWMFLCIWVGVVCVVVWSGWIGYGNVDVRVYMGWWVDRLVHGVDERMGRGRVCRWNETGPVKYGRCFF